ncbi:MAG: GNAT family N-acetyltransferase [Alphaproteobacteria bacterium]|nr:GNAT family N-acetyltransferase [Alphaproteobacteria bacterium]
MLETDRLFLRKWCRDDLPPLLELLTDPEVMKHSESGPLNDEQVSAWLDRKLTKTHDRDPFGHRAIELKATGQVIGYVSLSNAVTRSQAGDVELGIRLTAKTWRQGFAIEAAGRMIDFALEKANTMRVIGIVDPQNVRSVYLLQKLQMKFQREIAFDGYDHHDHLYALDRSPLNPPTVTEGSRLHGCQVSGDE